MAKQPICPLCGKPVAAKDRHYVVTIKRNKIVSEVIRHTQPCPK